jgi:alpha-tubulin suppressor-like RCC1 family protein
MRVPFFRFLTLLGLTTLGSVGCGAIIGADFLDDAHLRNTPDDASALGEGGCCTKEGGDLDERGGGGDSDRERGALPKIAVGAYDRLCGAMVDGSVKCSTGGASASVVSGLAPAADVAVGSDHACALSRGGAVQCWGQNLDGELGGDTNPSGPTTVTGLSNGASAIAVGAFHSCAKKTNGAVVCWGSNQMDALGSTVAPSESMTPLDVIGLGGGVSAISLSRHGGCAHGDAGWLRCWGDLRGAAPVDVTPPSPIQKVVGGGDFECVLTQGGGVQCLGSNFVGQVGNDHAGTDAAVFADVVGLASGVIGIASGDAHACALDGLGAVRCWGSNDNGQLGIPLSVAEAHTPAIVNGLPPDVVSIVANADNTCVLTRAGAALCWGTIVRSSTPSFISGFP